MVELAERLTQNELDQNTNWHVGLGGIQQPDNPARVLPLGTFLRNGQIHTPSNDISEALAELQRLRVAAGSNGKSHWSELPNTLLPAIWTMRLGGTRSRPSTATTPATLAVTPASTPVTSAKQESTREKKSKATRDDSEGSTEGYDGDEDEDDGKSEPVSADNDVTTHGLGSSADKTCSIGLQEPRDQDQEAGTNDQPGLTVLKSVRRVADNVIRMFKEVDTELREAEALVEANARLSRRPLLASDNLTPKHRDYLSPRPEQISNTAITPFIGLLGSNGRDFHSLRLARTERTPQTRHNFSELPTQGFHQQAHNHPADMDGYDDGLLPLQTPEEYRRETAQRRAVLCRNNAQINELLQQSRELMRIPGMPDMRNTPFGMDLTTLAPHTPFHMMATPTAAAARHESASSQVMAAPNASLAAPHIPAPPQVMAAPHNMVAAKPVSATSRGPQEAAARPDRTVDVGTIGHQSQLRSQANNIMQDEVDFDEDFDIDNIPYGIGIEWFSDRNPGKPTAGKGKNKARDEFKLNFTPDPALWELHGSPLELRYNPIPTQAPESPTETAPANAGEGKKRSREKFEADLTSELDGTQRASSITSADTPGSPNETEAEARKRAFDKEYNCIPDMRLDTEKRKQSRYVSFSVLPSSASEQRSDPHSQGL